MGSPQKQATDKCSDVKILAVTGTEKGSVCSVAKGALSNHTSHVDHTKTSPIPCEINGNECDDSKKLVEEESHGEHSKSISLSVPAHPLQSQLEMSRKHHEKGQKRIKMLEQKNEM